MVGEIQRYVVNNKYNIKEILIRIFIIVILLLDSTIQVTGYIFEGRLNYITITFLYLYSILINPKISPLNLIIYVFFIIYTATHIYRIYGDGNLDMSTSVYYGRIIISFLLLIYLYFYGKSKETNIFKW
jgi:CDP-diglyceride synthetase